MDNISNNTIITIGRQLGSGGRNIGRKLAEELGIKFYDKELIAEAAKESGRIVRTMEIKSQAPDHPSLLCAEETQYLKFFVLQVM